MAIVKALLILALAIPSPAAQPAAEATAVAVRVGNAYQETFEIPPIFIPEIPPYLHPNPNVQRWYHDAMDVGWQPSHWRKLSCIIERESKGLPHVVNTAPGTSATGLLQILAITHRRLIAGRDLFHGPTNLRIGYELWSGPGGGWGHWALAGSPCNRL